MAADWARPVVHWELQAKDAQKQREFYTRLFNWQIGDGPIMAVPAGIGGPPPGPGGHIRQGEHPGVTLYVQVGDIKASLERTAQLGGSVLSQPFDTPGGQTLAAITDPEGNRIMFVQQ